MSTRQAKRITRPLTAVEEERLQREQGLIASELPELIDRDHLRKEAREEATLSGELRRAIHASDQSIAAIAAKIGVTPVMLDEFLTGERTLRSDILDRLAQALGFVLQKTN
jgi:transcriptional regulator with XRE-family HTH domain